MYPGGFTVEVTTLSPKATEEDVYKFFAFCGEIEHIEIIRSSEYDCTAYVTFNDTYALETAVLLSGAFIEDQQIGISRMHTYIDESDLWNDRSILTGGSSGEASANAFVSSPGEAITVAQEVVKTMVAKGYVLGKDALVKAKALDESYKVSSNAAAKVAELSNRMGLTKKINAGLEVAKSIDGKYHVMETTKMAASYTGRTAVAAANSVVSSSYFCKGALWVSDILNRAAKASAQLAANQDPPPANK
ncbi:binding partner of ACD11 1-like [Impatiens glandulifera]|uniref:binding partner of ACD11 1-like n=1 Tax=Impatiens glandulifera TaxID=253017 RepID=UPI001FB0BA51|nr:binding partner of ACD11 1-like [Impatiens glandulifera]